MYSYITVKAFVVIHETSAGPRVGEGDVRNRFIGFTEGAMGQFLHDSAKTIPGASHDRRAFFGGFRTEPNCTTDD
jgi:hypothetical protein